ncbi:galactosylgalactosylxylosylprotein 3-beta-glucuronosyltransferase S [Schistocerca nitens]|uniref:galactosylgalactosylxylosylprotein 3-beta-glucuronosyltransferase S n=1 Tax=Schistocerca nitens TaxID=7011 RepID=UPI002117BF24|nr:galactosylgalactosylxylosylprotein 3-beta-glucuronosyltransferase S [Schistocerca nitens]XP_049805452.1 galactosylgalactosylxylosylprotein 3-beta-glucuronosyltransferase S [Schistocerca nitens]XP_049805453.1 galactosylgalactosylxylosylprotein 3-beta-glucuronosyltransferase S [Schistocerca nitens]
MLPLKNMFLFTIAMTIIVLYFVWSSQGKEFGRHYDHREHVFLCHMSFEDSRNKNVDSIPTIYFITPTYPRREQAAELTRLGQTLMHIPNLHWIVADDNMVCSAMITKLLKKFGIPFTHIASPMPEVYRKADIVPRGVANRRAALSWIRKHVKNGVIYFGDDDNTFDLELFEEIRGTKRVSMFPVGLIGDYAVSSPVLRKGRVIGFFDSWPSKRKFPVDMAGFAVNVEFLLEHPNATMPYKAGYEEDHFLRSLHLKLEDIEPKGNSCTQVLVWHTQTTKKSRSVIKIGSYLDTNLKLLLEELRYLGMGDVSSTKGAAAYLTKDGHTQTI